VSSSGESYGWTVIILRETEVWYREFLFQGAKQVEVSTIKCRKVLQVRITYMLLGT